jgi:hypothetical protein
MQQIHRKEKTEKEYWKLQERSDKSYTEAEGERRRFWEMNMIEEHYIFKWR